jgi:hypothetical protein
MSEPKLKVLAVVGSTHASSVTRVVLTHVAEELRNKLRGGCIGFEPRAAGAVQRGDGLQSAGICGTEGAGGGGGCVRARHAGLSRQHQQRVEEFPRSLLERVCGKTVRHRRGFAREGVDGDGSVAHGGAAMYAWSLPYGVAFAEKQDVVEGRIATEAFRARLEMFVRDTRVYGGLLAQQRRADLAGRSLASWRGSAEAQAVNRRFPEARLFFEQIAAAGSRIRRHGIDQRQTKDINNL